MIGTIPELVVAIMAQLLKLRQFLSRLGAWFVAIQIGTNQ